MVWSPLATFHNAIPLHGNSRVMKVIIWIMFCQQSQVLTLEVKDRVGKNSKSSKRSYVVNSFSFLMNRLLILMANTNLVSSNCGQYLTKENRSYTKSWPNLLITRMEWESYKKAKKAVLSPRRSWETTWREKECYTLKNSGRPSGPIQKPNRQTGWVSE